MCNLTLSSLPSVFLHISIMIEIHLGASAYGLCNSHTLGVIVGTFKYMLIYVYAHAIFMPVHLVDLWYF
jgi:hypothetical protein